jgi:hypothetical protein
MTTDITPKIESKVSDWEDEGHKFPRWFFACTLLLIAILIGYYTYNTTTIFQRETLLWSRSPQEGRNGSVYGDVEYESCTPGQQSEPFWRMRGDGGWELVFEDGTCR